MNAVSEERPEIRFIVPHGTPMPPPRPGVRYVSVPVVGVVVAGDRLRQRVDRFFRVPMMVLALLILPLLILDFVYVHGSQTRGLLYWLALIGFTLIWFAFLIEFIIKIAIAECRIEYVKRNWLDVVIILVPLFRPLRVFKATRGVVKTTRVFTLRGVGMKCARYVFALVIGLEATDRLLRRFGLRSDGTRRDPSAMTRHQLVKEVSVLRRSNDAWEAWYDAYRAHVDLLGLDPPPDPPEVDEDVVVDEDAPFPRPKSAS